LITEIGNHTVKKHRSKKETLDSSKPYHYLHEEEVQYDGSLKSVNTIFLTNKECPFKCVMCDLWRHTLDEPTPVSAIPKQIDYALKRLPKASVIKLYNSGNFFDGKAIPVDDYGEIADLLHDFEHVVVENHPKLIGDRISDFKKLLTGTFEVAMGLETIHPDVMPKLNKQITRDNFRQAVGYLIERDIVVRAFILLNPPFLKGIEENRKWCLKSVEFAFESGVSVCTIIPTRGGNGMMEVLENQGDFQPPTLDELEKVYADSLRLNKGLVFCDLWDLEQFSPCNRCIEDRKKRLKEMNRAQKFIPEIECSCRVIKA
jgi:radical SAM enzyme (TIGR01210 family)